MELTQIMLIPLIIATIGIFYSLPELFKELKKLKIKKEYLAILIAISISFLIFEILFVKPTERIFFDEHLYQDEATNILKQFNAKMCVYGTNETCKIFIYYHQGIAWAYIIALGYLISGINVMHTAWNLNLIFSTISILLLFFVCFMITKKETTSLISSFFYASTPLILIWTRTGSAETSLVFFSLLSILSFLIWMETKNKKISILLISSVIFAAQAKIEGVFILPILAIFYFIFSKKTDIEEVGEIFLLIILFLLPAFEYLFIQYQQDTFGAAENKKFSLDYFFQNIKTNSLFWFNYYQNGTPIQTQNVNNMLLPIFAILSIFTKNRELLKKIFAIFVWFIIPFLIYASFYAGSVTYGVDNRFMLSCAVPLILLASIGVSNVYDLLSKKTKILALSVVAILLFAYLYFFKELLPYVIVDPMQIWEAHDARVYVFDFVLKRYSEIPKDCYFVSFVPGLFRTLGRNGIYAENFPYLYNSGELKGKCLIFDYGYWCIVPPFHDSTCKMILEKYRTQMITNLTLEDGRTLAFYYILNSSTE